MSTRGLLLNGVQAPIPVTTSAPEGAQGAGEGLTAGQLLCRPSAQMGARPRSPGWPVKKQPEDTGDLESAASAALGPDTPHQRWAAGHLSSLGQSAEDEFRIPQKTSGASSWRPLPRVGQDPKLGAPWGPRGRRRSLGRKPPNQAAAHLSPVLAQLLPARLGRQEAVESLGLSQKHARGDHRLLRLRTGNPAGGSPQHTPGPRASSEAPLGRNVGHTWGSSSQHSIQPCMPHWGLHTPRTPKLPLPGG